MKRYGFVLMLAFVLSGFCASAQVDRHDVRKGNRDYRKGNYKEAEIDYRKALVKDSLSVAANYNLANALYRQNDYRNAASSLEKIKDVVSESAYSADYYFNVGDVALAAKDYKTAVEAFKASLLIRPDDIDAKENYIYAKKMLEDQQNNQNGGGGDDDRNKDNKDRNDDSNKDKNQDNNQDQNKDQQNQDNQNDNQSDNDSPQQQPDQQPKPDGNQPQDSEGQGISPQAAQQMLQAIQAKEKETQDKVNKEKAALLQSRQREKNW